ncbi:hypothetical protein QFZ83_002398 [Variovorax sp. W1I1]|uniref:hypothetical protein n=1 Tax=Variovorax sp. W1I1 TaxID=3042309 RepID=UPI00278663E5|nr:hypothetical protein [Variovorax sp. W1I1]MDQ0608227.1 hypothetical protein [Variovorax sp. W1I1]
MNALPVPPDGAAAFVAAENHVRGSNSRHMLGFNVQAVYGLLLKVWTQRNPELKSLCFCSRPAGQLFTVPHAVALAHPLEAAETDVTCPVCWVVESQVSSG